MRATRVGEALWIEDVYCVNGKVTSSNIAYPYSQIRSRPKPNTSISLFAASYLVAANTSSIGVLCSFAVCSPNTFFRVGKIQVLIPILNAAVSCQQRKSKRQILSPGKLTMTSKFASSATNPLLEKQI